MFGVYLRQDLLPIELEDYEYGTPVKYWYYKKICSAGSVEEAKGFQRGYMAGKEGFSQDMDNGAKPAKLLVMGGNNDWVLATTHDYPF